MSVTKKWLVNQLLDIFQSHKQIKNLIPTIIGYTKSGLPKYKKSPKFTPTLRMVLLAIVKFDQCYMSLQTISEISGVDRRNVQPNIKILSENNIIKVTKRTTKSGDSDSNLYIFDITTFLSFFELRKGVGMKHPHLSVDNLGGGRDVSSLGVGMKHPPIKQIRYNNKKQEREPLSIFVPNDANIVLAMELGVDLKENIESFMNRHKRDKTQYEFSIWLKQNKNHLGKYTGSSNKNTNEVYAEYKSKGEFVSEKNIRRH